MNQKLVIANWKMNGDVTSNASLLNALQSFSNDLVNTQVAVCPSYVFLGQAQQALQNTNIALGAQNLCIEEKGAYTGEISAQMLKEAGCQYALVGHSERRTLFAESDQHIAQKMVKAFSNGLTPVLCIGETLEQRDSGQTEAVILSQLTKVLEQVGTEVFKTSVIAYEPVWAIGTGLTATPEQAQQIHQVIRTMLTNTDAEQLANLAILYGGSVNENNADELIAQPDIDGFLVGGASLKAKSFMKICFAGN